MLDQLASQFSVMLTSVRQHVVLVAAIVATLWLVQCVNHLSNYRLNCFGIVPRTLRGFWGILLCPFLHGDFSHLLFNTIPLFVLSLMVLVSGLTIYIKVSGFIIVVGGLLTWVLGRKAIHVGASGYVMGLWAYLLGGAWYHFSLMTIILAILCLYYFSALFFSLFPIDKTSSFEGHLFGALAGVAAIFVV